MSGAVKKEVYSARRSRTFKAVGSARSTDFEQKLQRAKAAAFNRLKFVAFEKGANPVIGVDIDYREFSGNRIGVVANGTLMKLAPKGQQG